MATRPPENGKHVVREGEWAGSIAARYGYADWEGDVWKHASNAGLRGRREDPFTLAPGDDLFIPPWQERWEDRATEKRHKFRLKSPREVLRIRLLDDEGRPRENEPYTLEVDQEGGPRYEQQNDATDAEGVLTERLPPTARSGRLRLTKTNELVALDFGRLAPLDLEENPELVRGVQQRLKGLGFYRGQTDGKNGPVTRGAIAAFQQFCQDNVEKGDPSIKGAGPVDGNFGPQTRQALLSYYGC